MAWASFCHPTDRNKVEKPLPKITLYNAMKIFLNYLVTVIAIEHKNYCTIDLSVFQKLVLCFLTSTMR